MMESYEDKFFNQEVDGIITLIRVYRTQNRRSESSDSR